MAVLQGSVYVAELVADPSTDLTTATVACTVTAPDGSVKTVSSTDPSSKISVAKNVASLPVLATLLGTYLVVWSSTGGVVGAQQDQFTVRAAQIQLVSLPDLKNSLHIDANSTISDDELREWIVQAGEIIEMVTGPIRPHPEVDIFDGGVTRIVLQERWVSSITSIVDGWGPNAYTLTEQTAEPSSTNQIQYGYTWDRDTNEITRRDASGGLARFQTGSRSVTVSYIGGLTVIPAGVSGAAVELVRHWYRKNSTPFRNSAFGAATGDDMVSVGNYWIPNAVVEQLGPWRRSPQVA